MMDVSVIIVNYYSEKLIRSCINSLTEKTNGIDYEVLVVNNGSDSSGMDLLKSLQNKNTRVIDAGENLGFGKANNLGAEYALGKYLFLLNPDTELINNAVKILYDYLETNKGIGVCGGNLYSKTGEPVPSFCMEFDTLEKERIESSWRMILKNKFREKTKKQNTATAEFNYSGLPMEVGYIFGADMMLSKELFDSVKGFDRDFFMYAEEEELQRRIKDRGLKIISVPDAKIIHLEGATSSDSGRFSPRQLSMRLRGKLTYFDKCYPPDGAARFYKYRRSRYQKQLKWKRLKGRKTGSRTIDILDQVYAEYCSERES